MGAIVEAVTFKQGNIYVNNKKLELVNSSSRDVYRFGKYVVKIGDCQFNHEQNEQEYRMWRDTITPYDKRYFARTFEYGFIYDEDISYSVQEFIPYWKRCEYWQTPAKLLMKADQLIERFSKRYRLTDLDYRNIGTTRGRIMVIDYGV